MMGNDDLLDMPPNQLRICLMRARELPVMDVAEGLCSGSSDPFATLFVESINKDDNDMKEAPQKLRSTTKVQSLRPVWMERFDVPVDDAGAISASRTVPSFDATRVHLTMTWVVSFSSLRPFGPRCSAQARRS